MTSSSTYASPNRYHAAKTGPEQASDIGGPSPTNLGRRLTVRELLVEPSDQQHHQRQQYHHQQQQQQQQQQHHHNHHHQHQQQQQQQHHQQQHQQHYYSQQQHHQHHHHQQQHYQQQYHPQHQHARPHASSMSHPPTPLGEIGSPYSQHLSIPESGAPAFVQPLTPITTAASSPNPNSATSPSAQHALPHPQQPFTPTPHPDDSPASPLTLHERRERNKVASAKYRRKKQQQNLEMSCRIDDLNGRISTLTAENAMLIRQLDETKRENADLKDALDKLKSKLVEDKILKRLGRGAVRTKINNVSSAAAVRRKVVAAAAAAATTPSSPMSNNTSPLTN